MKINYLKKKIAKFTIFILMLNIGYQFIFGNINYVAADGSAPIITLIGSGIINLEKGSSYTEPGAEWSDQIDGTGMVSTISGTINTNNIGSYIIDYIKVNSLGLTGSITRTVNVIDTIAPAIPTISSTGVLTNKSNINITGTGDINEFINIYNSGIIVGSGIVNSSGSFDISVVLNEGENILKTKSYDSSGNYSDFSNSIIITLNEGTGTIDYCPAGDKSGNFYDLICGKAKGETGTGVILDKPNLNKHYYFYDLENSFSKSYVEILQNKGVIKIYSGRLFIPDKKITRAEFLALAMKAFEINLTSTGTNSFTDIPSNLEWVIPYLIKAKELGVINGQNENGKLRFKPNQAISRIEALSILFKIAKIDINSSNRNEFNDNDFQNWMIPYAKKAKELKITDGQNENGKLKFKPNGNMTRAEASKFIVKFLEFIK